MSELNSSTDKRGPLFLLLAMLLTAMAAGTGWGIRGQYGHETGAMNAGALASLTLLMLFVPHLPSLTIARAAAMMTIAIGIGGSMTYGQTVGLTHDGNLVGNWSALRWGMLGLLIKGGIWIGFGGAFLGIALSGKKYRPWEIFGLMLALVGLMFLGGWLLNSPFEPSEKILPRFYFSDDWRFEEGEHVKPRPEVWGGYLFSLIGLMAYVRLVRGDKLALRMALFGFLAGGLGFPGGQTLQAFHAWNPDMFKEGGLLEYNRLSDQLGNVPSFFVSHFNWWNIMETTFGFIWGGIMALGLWLNRHLIAADPDHGKHRFRPTTEMILIAVHLILLVSGGFFMFGKFPGRSAPTNDLVYFFVSNPQMFYQQIGLVMAIIPIVGCIRGRIWPYVMVTAIVAIPIMAKTLSIKGYLDQPDNAGNGWMFLVVLPLAVLICTATYFCAQSFRNATARYFVCTTLVLMAWTFFGLNSEVFDHAWPWKLPWGGRHPNQLMFLQSCIALTGAALIVAFSKPPETYNIED